MRKRELARRLARHSGLTSAEAADHLDRVVHEIVASLKKLPGLGELKPAGGGIAFEPEDSGEPDERRRS